MGGLSRNVDFLNEKLKFRKMKVELWKKYTLLVFVKVPLTQIIVQDISLTKNVAVKLCLYWLSSFYKYSYRPLVHVSHCLLQVSHFVSLIECKVRVNMQTRVCRLNRVANTS